MPAKMKILKDLQSVGSTHSCPECNKPAYCAMEDGKSANLCWCMFETGISFNPYISTDNCLCKKCLNNQEG
jgi:hypothetical protein